LCRRRHRGREELERELLTIFGLSSGGNAVPLSVLEKLVLIEPLMMMKIITGLGRL
jgi:hypothetical protein